MQLWILDYEVYGVIGAKVFEKDGHIDIEVYVNGVSGSWPGDKHTISYLPEGYDSEIHPEPDPQDVWGCMYKKCSR